MEVIHVSHMNRQAILSDTKPCVMALGFFDGVHLGHQKVIKVAKEKADEKRLPLAVMSFFPHPKEVLSKEDKPIPYLMPIEHKQNIFENLGVDIFYIVKFDQVFARLSPEQFVKEYILDFKSRVVVAGFDFTYGFRGQGNMDRIHADSQGKVEGIKVDKVDYNGEKISSTLVRSVIANGDVEKLPNLLGDFYSVEGIVKHTKNRLNVILHPHYLLPKCGFYQVQVETRFGSFLEKAQVYDGKVCLISIHNNLHSFLNNEKVSIYWTKQVSEEYLEALY